MGMIPLMDLLNHGSEVDSRYWVNPRKVAERMIQRAIDEMINEEKSKKAQVNGYVDVNFDMHNEEEEADEIIWNYEEEEEVEADKKSVDSEDENEDPRLV
jgi:hypothetical protein